jgi:ADP-heptose:LPS heptosyltransferase
MKELLRALDGRLAFSAARFLSRHAQPPQAGRLPGISTFRRVIVVRLDSIGDMVLTTPFLRELRRSLPQASITLVVRPAVHNLVALCPHVDEVLSYAGADVRPRSAIRALVHARRFGRRHLSHTSFDLAVLPRFQDDAAFAAMVATACGARWRVGYSGSGLLTHVRPSGGSPHEVARSLDLVRFVGGDVMDDRLELWLDDADRQFAAELYAAHGADTADFILGVGVGAGSPRRQWPVERYVEVARWSLANRGGFVLVAGGEDDRESGEQIRAALGPRVINAAGAAPVRGMAALLARCRLFVGNDSGPMHVAAAMGVPVVEVSCHPEGGSPDHENSPVRFGPWRVPHQIVRPAAPRLPCLTGCTADAPHCIDGISTDNVTGRIAALSAPAD